MNLNKLKALFSINGCDEIYIKRLARNDLSKSQVYIAGDFDVLNIFPISQIIPVEAGKWKDERFKATLKFAWISNDGGIHPAPRANFILYPAYPEVRFSGFLAGCEQSPSDIMNHKIAGRLLFLSVAKDGTTLGYAAEPDSEIAREFSNLSGLADHGVFSIIELSTVVSNRIMLLQELARIHSLNWIQSKRLDSDMNVLQCKAPNCGGYTLEAELGITPNGYSDPDFKGWEVKQFGVNNFSRTDSSVITLMTPEPTDGLYKTEGIEYFIRTYGYPDRNGIPDRLNFGGVHRTGIQHSNTRLEMKLIGFDEETGKIRNSNGRIALVDENKNEAASWSFSSLLLHWNRKHDKACYVPSLSRKENGREYRYGNRVILGTYTDFQLFLKQMASGNIYYDPGIKLENASSKPKIKRRSQFRIKSGFLPNLYKKNEIIDLLEISNQK